MPITAAQIHCKTVTENINPAVDFQNYLDLGELITGTPTVISNPVGPTISSVAISTTILSIAKSIVPIGKAVTFHVTGGTAGTRYILTVAIDTDASPSQHRELDVVLDVA